MFAPGYLALGHLTLDVPAPTSLAAQLGGTVLFATQQAAALGWRTAIVTAIGADCLPLPTDCCVHQCASSHCTRFCNQATDAGRVQLLLAQATPLGVADVPTLWRAAPLWHLAPVAHDITFELMADAAEHAPFAVMTPQGMLRQWDAIGQVRFAAWADAPRFLPAMRAVVLSIADVAHDWDYIRYLAGLTTLLVVTQGEAGVTVYTGGTPQHLPPVRALQGVDAVGAGDTFAAAFFCEFYLTHDAHYAAHLAQCHALRFIETQRQHQ